ncbi:MAG: sulfide/dihydroorotate dehydrogenase-like FAD/NAD-binding protein [Candidatus Lokiarchaeota archaeon]|nr:sulfide/dihydroorotate dehydrogenase-like FAD/NAD-binding protein [Candidatus Lokiarchaeota archaeon]
MSENKIEKGKLIIDDKEIEFTKGQTILEAANEAGIYIPTLCYIEDLESYGGCRLCIVKVEGMKAYPTACTTPALEMMKVKNDDKEIQMYRKEVFELLLSEHPHSCLICSKKENCEKMRKNVDKFGRIFGCFTCASKSSCELRVIADYLGVEDISYELEYHKYPLKRDDPFFEKDYNLCILCGKCVRICNELRGYSAINFVNRGHKTQISTEFDFPSVNSNCQFCGSCVDICPTGALSSKNTKWNENSKNRQTSICGFCNVGCGFDYLSNQGTIVESTPNKRNIINKGHGCVIGRFCTSQFNNGRDRLKYPSIKKNRELIPTDWNDVYSQIRDKLKKYNPEEIALIASSNMSNESAYVLNKFGKQILKTENISIISNSESVKSYYGVSNKIFNNYLPLRSFYDIEQANLILLINTNIQISHPILFNYIVKAKKSGAKIISLNINNIQSPKITKHILDYEINFSREEILQFLIELSKRYLQIIGQTKSGSSNYEEFLNFINNFKYIDNNEEVIKLFDKIIEIITNLEKNKGIILLDLEKKHSNNFLENLIGTLFNLLTLSENKISLIPLFYSGNKEGVFQNISYNTTLKSIEEIKKDIKDKKIKVLYLMERFEDTEILKDIEFLILQDIYLSNNYDKADIILPTCTFLEETGSFLNAELKIQKFQKCIDQIGHTKPDWQILCELAKNYDENNSKEFSYESPEEILNEIKSKNPFFNHKLKEYNLDNQKFFIPYLNKSYSEDELDPFMLKSFKFRGESIYNQVKDLKELIDYKKTKYTIKNSKKKLDSQKQSITPFKVLSNSEIVPNTYELIVEAPLIAKKAKPGNFIILMKNKKSERLPLTLSDWDINKGFLKIYYQEKGFSTRELTSLKKGNYIFSIVGPLGKEYPIEKYGTVLLGGGCYGNAAIYPIAKALKEVGNRVIILIEGKNQMDLYLEEEFKKISDEIIYCTSDGSKGLKGKVDVGINYVFKKEKHIDRCHFIGCNYMMMDASNTTKIYGAIPTTVSLSTIMIDGTGMCGCCRLTLIKNGKEITKFACVDGPIFNGHLVKWDELVSRCNQYDFSEKQIFQTHSCRLNTLIEEFQKDE